MTAQLGLADLGEQADATPCAGGTRRAVAAGGMAVLERAPLASRPAAAVRRSATVAAASGTFGAAVIVVLHLLPAGRALNPVSEPISNYALTSDGWLFDVGVIGLTLGLIALLSALVRSGCVAVLSPSFAVMGACCAGLVGVVVFPDQTSGGGSFSGPAQAHWAAAMLTFGGLALAPALIGHRRASECSPLPRVARWLSVSSGWWFTLLFVGSILRVSAALPLPVPHIGGVVERALVGTEVVVAGVLTAWAWRGCPCRAGTTEPPAGS